MEREEFWSVDKVATALDVHPKTVRRYIRDGRLNAHKVGGQWRIKRSDLESFMEGEVPRMSREITDDLKGFVEGHHMEIEGPLQVCTIIDYYVDTLRDAMPVSQALLDLMNSGDPEQGAAKFHYHFDPGENKARFVLWGNPRFLAKMLKAVGDKVPQRA